MFKNLILNEYIWSSLVTFIAAFGAALVTVPAPSDWGTAAIFGIISVGVRAGVKAVINLLATKFTTISSKPQN